MRRMSLWSAFALAILIVAVTLPVWAVATRTRAYGRFAVRVQAVQTYLQTTHTWRDTATFNVARDLAAGQSHSRDGSYERFTFNFESPLHAQPQRGPVKFSGRINYVTADTIAETKGKIRLQQTRDGKWKLSGNYVARGVEGQRVGAVERGRFSGISQ